LFSFGSKFVHLIFESSVHTVHVIWLNKKKELIEKEVHSDPKVEERRKKCSFGGKREIHH
jgi:hypothetical protein